MICDLILDGASLRSITERGDMPASSTVHSWIADSEHPFSERYARACAGRGIRFGEMVSEIALGVLTGRFEADQARVAMDGLKWSAARMAPRRYGDRMEIAAEVNAQLGVLAIPVTPASLSEWEELDVKPVVDAEASDGTVREDEDAPAARVVNRPDKPQESPAVKVTKPDMDGDFPVVRV